MGLICDYDRFDVDYEPQRYGYCPCCERNVETKKMDFGIGAYEYWGSKEVHSDVREVCAKCEEDVEEVRSEDEDDEE